MMDGTGKLALDFSGKLGSFVMQAAFKAPMRGVTGLFGPSGSGKTSILRAIAGLEKLNGRFSLGADVWQDDARGIFRKPHQRAVGYVFQEASLFPHLNVRKNLLYAARRAGTAPPEQAIDFDDTVGLLGIEHLLERDPQSLSGGERQRVAIGRALLSQPALMLMDEPLSALDRMTRAEFLPLLETLHRQLVIPVLYVSHDMTEIERLANTLVLIDQGRVLACGPIENLEADPDLPLLRTVGAAAILDGVVGTIDCEYELTTVCVDGGQLIVPGLHGSAGSVQRLRIAASDVSFVLERQEGTTILNSLPVRILSVTDQMPGHSQVSIVAALGENGDGAKIIAHITRKSCDNLGLAPGQQLFAQIKSVALLASEG